MKALLMTRCGCSRMVDIPYMGERVFVPTIVRTDWWIYVTEVGTPPGYPEKARRFDLMGARDMGGGELIQIYQEVES